uniref:Plastocyanin-like domain-containing protein n=1 Tax=Spongospora subterranea TaxID=70186 RepID=A0A0H5R735_9EUKA|eukprot:CRZ09641.1 hypothetical protein [Spongospora subterranea]
MTPNDHRYEQIDRGQESGDEAENEDEDESEEDQLLIGVPDRHDIWDQPWWVFFLTVLLLLGLIAASITVHAAVCTNRSPLYKPISKDQFTILKIRQNLVSMNLGLSNVTACRIPRMVVDGSGPSWMVTPGENIGAVRCTSEQQLVLSVGNTLQSEPVHLVTESLLGMGDIVSPMHTRFLPMLSVDQLLTQTAAGTATLTSANQFHRGQGLVVPMLIGGDLPHISDIYTSDLVGVIDRATDFLFVMQDACPLSVVSESDDSIWKSCSCAYPPSSHTLSSNGSTLFGAVFANNHFSSHMHYVNVKPDALVRLRIFNAASGTNFHINVTSDDAYIKSIIVAVDGQWVEPVELEDVLEPLWIGVGQRMDVLIFVPSRRWTQITVIAIEEGDGLRRQIGMTLETEHDAKASSTDNSPSRLVESSYCSTWNNERLFNRLPLIKEATETICQSCTQEKNKLVTTMVLGQDNTINGFRYGDEGQTSLKVSLGDQVNITFVNEAHDAISMRIQGHTFVVTEFDDVATTKGAIRDTILIPPSKSIMISFEALNPGSFVIASMHEIRRQRGMAIPLEYSL